MSHTSKHSKEHKPLLTQRGMRRLTALLGCLVLVCTVSALTLPASTQEGSYICGAEEHQHGESCYSSVITESSLVCPQKPHEHEAACLDGSGTLVCGYSDFYVHVHNELCMKDGALVCCIPQIIKHSHEESCFEQTPQYICGLEELPAHSHADECFEQQSNLICTEAEHSHSAEAACFDESGNTVCTLTEHSHNEQCSELVSVPVCGLEVSEGHSHSDACLGEPVSTLICILPEVVLHSHGADCFDKDGKLICPIMEVKEHYHGEECFETTELPCEPYLVCTLEVHVHSDSCLEQKSPEYICNLAEHSHSAEAGCFDEEGNTVCTLAEHSHEDACLAENEAAAEYICGLEEHSHSAEAGCFDEEGNTICTLTEHSHEDACTDSKKDAPTYICGLEEHTHSAETACFDEEGNTVCTLAEHSHDDTCIKEEPVELSEEEAAAIAAVEALIDALPCSEEIENTSLAYQENDDIEGEEAYLSELFPKVYEAYWAYADLSEEHQALVKNADKLMELEWIWSFATLEEPATRGKNYSGIMYHYDKTPYYRWSPLKPSGTIGCHPFILIHVEDKDNWSPSTGDGEWSATAGANYDVAYCIDWRTSSTTSGAEYTKVPIEYSRFGNDVLADRLEIIIANSYPFISIKEMNDRSGMSVTEAEAIVGVQWAIWELTTHDMPELLIAYNEYTGDPTLFKQHQEMSLLKYTADNHGPTAAVAGPNCRAVTSWLLGLSNNYSKVELTYGTPQLTSNGDGTFRLEVPVKLNRALGEYEKITYSLSAGDIDGLEGEITSGDSFTVVADGIDYDLLVELGATVHADFEGQGVQAYVYDNTYYQDMVGGLWGVESYNLDMVLGREELTSVAVTKNWVSAGSVDIDSVKVWLIADGRKYGEAVELSEANGWTYKWDSLPKYNFLSGKEISYTVYEEPVPGFTSAISLNTSTDGVTYKAWEQCEKINDNGIYTFVSNYGALGVIYNTKLTYQRYMLMFENFDINDPYANEAVLWQASSYSSTNSNAQFRPVSVGSSYWLTRRTDYDNYLSLGDEEMITKVKFEVTNSETMEGVLSYSDSNKGGSKRYFYCLDDSPETYKGRVYPTTDKSKAETFRLFKIVEKTAPTADKNYIITNYESSSSTSVTSITANKVWAGRLDNNYPASVRVTLQQNGNAYGSAVVLNAANNWQYTWNNLPVRDQNGVGIIYSVKEAPVTGYDTSYSAWEIGDTSITITNTWIPTTVPVTLYKVSTANESSLLPDAVFDLYAAGSSGVSIPGTTLTGTKLGSFTTDSSGKISLGELSLGVDYYLVETSAPEGFSKLPVSPGFKLSSSENGVEITVISGNEWLSVNADNALSITAKNEPGYVLPNTGGHGTLMHLLAGTVICLAAAMLLGTKTYRKNRIRRESANH